jgi:carboxylesterase
LRVDPHERRAAGAPNEGGELDLPGGPDAALVLHGLTGSTVEVRPLVERLHAAGLRVLAPSMAGHGGATAGLRGVPWSAWVAQAERDLARLAGARRTFVVGLSMGAMVACALADAHPERAAGLVLLAPALQLTWPGRLGAWLGKLPLLREVIVAKRASDVRAPVPGRPIFGLDGIPLSAVTELARLERSVDALLPRLRAPALVVAGAHDRTVTVRGARRLAARLAGPVELVVLPESGHLVLLDQERERCVEEAIRFLTRLGAGSSGAGSFTDSAERDRSPGR